MRPFRDAAAATLALVPDIDRGMRLFRFENGTMCRFDRLLYRDQIEEVRRLRDRVIPGALALWSAGREHKAMRWLGYAQGVLVALGFASLDDVRACNRSRGRNGIAAPPLDDQGSPSPLSV